MSLPPTEFWDQIQWVVLHARSRHEKLVDWELQKKGIETFLPIRKITRLWSDRFKEIKEPIFSGYLFVRLALKNRLQVFQTKGPVRLVDFDSYPAFQCQNGI